MRPSVYVALCLLSASSSGATLISRTANRIHHAAVKRSAKFAKDIRSVLSNVLIEQPIIGPDTGNRIYCVASPQGGIVQNPTSSTPTPTGGNGVIVSSINSRSSSRRPTSTSGGSPVPTATSDWKLVETREGASFFDGWDFWSLAGALVRSFVGNRSLILFCRSHQRYACLLHQSLHQLNQQKRTGIVDYLTEADAVGFISTHAWDRLTNDLLSLVAIQRTHRCKF